MPQKRLQQLVTSISFRIALPSLFTILLFIAAIFYVLLPQLEESFIHRKQEAIKELTETVWSLLESYYEREQSGELTRQDAQQRATARIRNLRYGPEKKDYFWINDMHPRMIMHPYRKDLEGEDISTFQDANGIFPFIEFVRIVKEQESGYVNYMWQWKDDPEKISAKSSYVMAFKPWGWIIGTGMYIDDVEAEIAQIRNKLSLISIGILCIVSILAAYSIRQSMVADRERRAIFMNREQLMESLEQSNTRFRNLLETTSDWIWESDQDGKYTYSSSRVTDMLGFDPEETIGKTLMDIASPRSAAQLADAFEKLLQSKQNIDGFECTCLGKSGQIVVLENNAVPVFSHNGEPELVGYRGIARDITERKIAMEALKKSRDDLHASLEETVSSLASTAENRDPYTAGHQQRVDRLACAIAKNLGLPPEQIEGLHIAALLHDIGKITLPFEYLAKPTSLNKDERAIIRHHPEVGYNILKTIHFPWPVAEIVYQHHEVLDGSGYPRGLTDQDILLEAKILAVADVVEAMSSHRPYRPSLGIEKAMDEIRKGRGVRYHAPSVDSCLYLIQEKKINGNGDDWCPVFY
ncbi:cache domain-containing protein [Desulfogranum japonicum]|uniref:cache domain-containing protein n=1 Tax=Desulfogranum japonicum TaxID=231447 RepID=UPI0004093B80|nr:HD domain-containing phosphohydrolase [Desulfogranum japonicum]